MLKINIDKYLYFFSEFKIKEINKFKKVYINLLKNKHFKKLLLDDPYYAFYYCSHIVEGRCEEIEVSFMKSSEICLNYAGHVLVDDLPNDLHNFMICKLLEGDNAAKNYFLYLKNKNSNIGPWGEYK